MPSSMTQTVFSANVSDSEKTLPVLFVPMLCSAKYEGELHGFYLSPEAWLRYLAFLFELLELADF
jgi:hypothetical protein